MSLTTLTSVQKLQTALHAKAKESPDFRFHALYDKVYRKDVLVYACKRCKANGGAAGVDNQTFEDIEQHDLERWLDELAQELKSQTYQPQPVRRVYISKRLVRSSPFRISWHGIRDSPMNLLTNGFVNNCGRLFGPSEQFEADIVELGLKGFV